MATDCLILKAVELREPELLTIWATIPDIILPLCHSYWHNPTPVGYEKSGGPALTLSGPRAGSCWESALF